MNETSRAPPAILMTLRLWQEPLGNAQSEWRGAVKNLATGEVRYFRQWDEIAPIVRNMLCGAARTDVTANAEIDVNQSGKEAE